jgi:O-antigen ligase
MSHNQDQSKYSTTPIMDVTSSVFFLIYFGVAFFFPVTVFRPTNFLIILLPLLLWGNYLFRYNKKRKWYILILFGLLIRLIGQFAFDEYQSPYIMGDLYRVIMYLITIYIFTELFKNKENFKNFVSYMWKLSHVLILIGVISYVLHYDLVMIDDQNRFRWYAWPNAGGPGVSKVFAFIGIIYLYNVNNLYPDASIKEKLYNIIKISPHIFVCILGGTRLSIFIFILTILLYVNIPKKILALVPVLIYVFFNAINKIASFFPGFSRLQVRGSGNRFMIWNNFIEKLLDNDHAFWFGYGPGYVMIDIYDPVSGTIGGYFYAAHNLFIQVWLGYGILIFIPFTVLYIWFVYKVAKTSHSNNVIFGFMGLVLVSEIFATSYLAYDSNWTIAASYAILFNSIDKRFLSTDSVIGRA